MTRLEALVPGVAVRGLLPNGTATVIQAQFRTPDILYLVYKDAQGSLHDEVIDRDREVQLDLVEARQSWRFDADGELLKLVSEAQRIRWAHLFDPYVAVHTSHIDPLPHQITAVYEEMLPRQPLRYLLADDPGAGKTIMAGLLIKELRLRGDLERCLIVCPGSLVEQWQDELDSRFQLPFELLTNERISSARTGNVFHETPLAIGRLDRLARNEDLLHQLDDSEWDLIVVDEAHKMSATYFGGEVKYTRRYRLGQRLSKVTRHFLLMTATPHNGKEEDFQLFMALLDPDRFAGRFRQGVHQRDVSDLMRRMVKEQLVKFDGKPLFPERIASTVPYRLSPLEAELYDAVTTYVREEFNRAEQLEDGGRRGAIGFALTILQRRLASSPEAIYQSLRRRREKLEGRLAEYAQIAIGRLPATDPILDLDAFDDDEYLAEELEDLEEKVVDQATAAETVEELRIEIDILRDLEALAAQVRNQRTDRKWEELSGLLQEQHEMFDEQGRRRKLVIFTEHKDTLSYLVGQIQSLLGRPEAVVFIHGGVRREERRAIQAAFTQDPDVVVLVATDAAGEGINLQRAHLMVNYDLPWNPNRLEQRFGRIHRIGQQEVCHLWNLLAEGTREGDVYATLLRKLEQERETLGGAVFDVLGKAVSGQALRRLMIEAVRYGNRPDVRARLDEEVADALDRRRLEALLAERALSDEFSVTSRVEAIRQRMAEMEARRLQPHYIHAFFSTALTHYGGQLQPREVARYEIRRVPARLRRQGDGSGRGDIVARRYERICFQKEQTVMRGKPRADLIAPGHPLLEALIDLLLAQYGGLLQQGAVLIDDNGDDLQPRLLVYLEHVVRDGRPAANGERRVVSRRYQFVERPLALPPGLAPSNPGVAETADPYNAGPAPYLDYRVPAEVELAQLAPILDPVRHGPAPVDEALLYALQHMVRPHLDEVRAVREPLLRKTMAAVKERLTSEIAYWDYRARQLEEQERAGKTNARLNSGRARERVEGLQLRLQQRLGELEQARQLAAMEPLARGGALVVPQGLLHWLAGTAQERIDWTRSAAARRRVELAAMAAVMRIESELGYDPQDVGAQNLGYDVLSLTPDGQQRFIEVKGRAADATTVTVTHNEIMTARNKPQDWILALVRVDVTEVADLAETAALYTVTRYVPQPFDREPDSLALSSNYDLARLPARGYDPGASG